MNERKLPSNNPLAIPQPQPPETQSLPSPFGAYAYASQPHPLRDFLKVLTRRKAIALQTFVLIVALGVALTLMTKPVYQTGARILVQGKTSMFAITNTQDPLNNLFLPEVGYAVNTQVELLRSPLILDRAYKAAALPPGSVSLDARQVGMTDMIDLTVTSGARQSAEKFATLLPHVYLDSLKESRMSELNSALSFANQRLRESATKLSQSELALQRYKQKEGITGGDEERAQEFEALVAAQSNVTQGRSEVTRLQAQLAALQTARGQLPALSESFVRTANPKIQDIRERLNELQDKRNDALYLYKPSEDPVKIIDRQIASLQSRLARLSATVTTKSQSANPDVAEMNAKIADTRVSLQAATSSLKVMSARADVLSSRIGKYTPAERVIDRLRRDIASSQSAVESFTKSAQDLTLRQRAAQAKNNPVTIVAAAGPAAQVAPDVRRNMVMVFLVALVIGCGAAMLQEVLDDHISDEDETRRLLGVPILGHVPLVEVARGQRPSLLGERPDAEMLESFRVLRSNVGFTMVTGPHRTLLITSTIPGEGKSSTAANLAVAMAMDNRRIVLVDADLRRPQINQLFGLAKQPGLTQVLVGQASLEEALQPTQIPSLRVLTAGALPPNPAELLNSPAMHELVEKLKTTTDTIIFDSPPCLATADAQVLASQVDGVIYVMELGNVHKSAVRRSFELLDQARAQILGILFNKVDEASNRYYGYSYYGKYYKNTYLEGGEADLDGHEPEPTLDLLPENGVTDANGHWNHQPYGSSDHHSA